MSKRQYWLMKSEPDVYSIDDLEKDGTEPWDSIRNYEARNNMRDEMNVGDRALFYHSNVRPPVITGVMEVCSESYPDPTQFNPDHDYFDPKSSEEDPTWHLVDVKFIQKFDNPVTRDELKKHDDLLEMQLFKRNRLSITKVRESEYKKILKLADAEEK
ncbi:MAG: EVE domain-containing protein [Balneolaceae bacterium]|nr:EVE domain-containing protein [Balneolaceae bacterium]